MTTKTHFDKSASVRSACASVLRSTRLRYRLEPELGAGELNAVLTQQVDRYNRGCPKDWRVLDEDVLDYLHDAALRRRPAGAAPFDDLLHFGDEVDRTFVEESLLMAACDAESHSKLPRLRIDLTPPQYARLLVALEHADSLRWPEAVDALRYCDERTHRLTPTVPEARQLLPLLERHLDWMAKPVAAQDKRLVKLETAVVDKVRSAVDMLADVAARVDDHVSEGAHQVEQAAWKHIAAARESRVPERRFLRDMYAAVEELMADVEPQIADEVRRELQQLALGWKRTLLS